MRQYKQYKAVAPEVTVSRIKEILSNCGIKVKEVEAANSNNTFFSAHLHICNNGLLPYGLSTNGKGVTPAFALASAYGELMERIQSGILFKQRIFLVQPFHGQLKSQFCANGLKSLLYYFAPDEIVVYGEERKNVLDKYVALYDMESVKGGYTKDFEILLPFYNVMRNRVENIPQRILEHACGSNGMSAGNTAEEAILQGLCEIFERYALRKLYEDNLTPPDIPLDFFKDREIYWRIQELKSTYGYEIRVKDCSVGMNLPVIGVLIIDKTTNRYEFHLGADTVPHVALERVLTELFQNRSELELKQIDFALQYSLLSDTKLKERERVKYSFMQNYMPITIFGDTPSYTSDWFTCDDWGVSDPKDLRLLVSLLSDNGYTLYVRDVSFLGFPSFITYIPGMSELINVESLSWFNATFEKNDRISEIAHSLPSSSEAEIQELIGLVSRFNEPEYLSFFNNKDVWNVGNPLFVLGVLSLVVKNYDNALKYFNKALVNTTNSKLIRFYSLYRDYSVVMKSNPKDVKYLISIYSQEEIEIVEKCVNERQWLNVFNISSCFNCSECKISDGCSYQAYSELLLTRENLYVKNLINQNSLSKIFQNG